MNDSNCKRFSKTPFFFGGILRNSTPLQVTSNNHHPEETCDIGMGVRFRAIGCLVVKSGKSFKKTILGHAAEPVFWVSAIRLRGLLG